MEDVNDATSNEEVVEQPQNTGGMELSNIVQEMETSNKQTEQTTIQQPVIPDGNYHEIKGLPSKYKLYPDDTIIKARPMKVIEVKKLSSINEYNADDIINDVLRRTVIGIDINDILLADKLFIIFWLRANTYRDSSYVVDFTCPKCECKSNYHYELDNLEVNYLKDDYDASDVTLKLSGDSVALRFLTISDEKAIDRFKETNENTIKEIDDELLGLASMITHVNGQEGNLLDKYKYVLELQPGDYVQISSIIEKNAMGIEPWLRVKCEECGGTAQIGISFRTEFFIPTYKA